MKKVLKKIGVILGIILAAALLFVGFAWINHITVKAPEIPAKVSPSQNGLVRAEGKGIYEADGSEIVLRGVNAGAWFVTEGWLVPYAATDEPADKGEYATLSEDEYRAALQSNPNLTDAQIEELMSIYYDTWFTEKDVERIAEMGFNVVRLPFTWRNLMVENADGSFSRIEEEKAFARFDQVLSWCKKYGIYAVLDLHCAPGSQNGYEHSGYMKYGKDCTEIHFWDNEVYVAAMADLWKSVCEHYASSELTGVIAAYDIFNEPQDFGKVTTKKCWDIFDVIYDAIRETGDEHCVMFEGNWWFSALPKPEKYGWENVIYSYHWYNWNNSWLPDDFFYMFQDLTNIGCDYNVPVFIGEFTYFDNQANWNKGLGLMQERHYSWTLWTYKMCVYGWWDNTWGLYNLNVWDGDEYTYKCRINVATASYDEIKEFYLWCTTDNATTSNTVKYVKEFFAQNK